MAGCLGDDDDDDDDPGDDGDDTAPADLGEPVPELEYVSLTEDVHPNRNLWSGMHADNLQELGFDINITFNSVPEYVDRGFVERTFDLYPLRWGDGFDPDRVLNDFFSEAATPEGGGNVGGWIDDHYEELLEDSRRAMDPDDRQAIVHEIQEYVIEDEHVISPIFVMPRPMPYWSSRYENVVEVPEDGLASLWSMLEVTPTGDGDDQLIIGQTEDLEHYNPFGSVTRAEREQQSLVYDRLAQVPADGGPPEPWVAESWEWTDDTTCEVTLRDGLTWHDGEPLTAEDVVFTFEYGPQVTAGRESVVADVENVTAETDLEVTFELELPSAPFENRVLAGRDGSLVPQHIWEDIDPSEAPEEHRQDPVGSGPFEVTDFTIGEQARLQANDDHFNPPNIDELVRIQYANTRAAVDDIEAGAVDMLPFAVDFDDIDRLEGIDGIDVAMPWMTSTHYCAYNVREDQSNGIFSDVRVRRAAGHAIPKIDANDIALAGTGEILHTCFSHALEFWHNPDIEEFHLDLARSEELLADAGFGWDDDGQIHFPADW